MKDYAIVGTCPICGQGRLIIARDNALGTLYVLCEECESEWNSPEDTKSLEAATHGRFGQSTLVTKEQMEGHPWWSSLW